MPTKHNKNDLTPNEQIFCDEWLTDRNGTRAYKVAYKHIKKDSTAAVQASKLLNKPNVKAYTDKRLAEVSEKKGITFERIIDELAAVAFLDIRKLVDDEGNLIAVSELDDETAAALSSIEVKTEYVGKGIRRKPIYNIDKLKFWNKLEALGKVADMLKLSPPQKIALTDTEGRDVNPYQRLKSVIKRHRADN